MNEKSDNKGKKTLSLSKDLDPSKIKSRSQIRQSFSHGRSKSVEVEVKKRRFTPKPSEKEAQKDAPHASDQEPVTPSVTYQREELAKSGLTPEEIEARIRALQGASKAQEEDNTVRSQRAEDAKKRSESVAQKKAEKEELDALVKEREEAAKKAAIEKDTPEKNSPPAEEVAPPVNPLPSEGVEERKAPKIFHKKSYGSEEEGSARKGAGKTSKSALASSKREEPRRRQSKMSVQDALSDDLEEERARSLSSLRRAREREKEKLREEKRQSEGRALVREVTIPETITVQELSSRMAVRGGAAIKALMNMGMMVTINQVIDADTAELLVTEFGHIPKRVSEADIEVGLKKTEDKPSSLKPRAPVVTVMGHVDHGKTSLLDAFRTSDVAAHEAGGITQHIGAYQVKLSSGKEITFIDTPGHAAFTEMRARGANVTDLVVLVVAANDGIKEQTIEAINHVKAANVPLIIAINKIDLPEANAQRVRDELLSHEIVLEEYGGDVMSVEVSAKTRDNLDKLEELILLQAEVMDLKANASCDAEGVVIEAKLEKGRGPVATVLVQRGTLRVGDLLVSGPEWGRVRALLNERGDSLNMASPSQPVEILGLSGAPSAGDDFVVVDHESRAREVVEYRQSRIRQAQAAARAPASLEQMFSDAQAGEKKRLGVVVKSDVQGSLEAIIGSFAKFENDEVIIQVLHAGVGGVNESDVTLAKASNGVIIGFNVRANPQARDLARRDNVPIKYYSIIYEVMDDIKASLEGMLNPLRNEKFLGRAEVREVFKVTKVGKVAGCYVTEGIMKRGVKARLTRDSVVIHEGPIKALKRFKDDAAEVRESFECGVMFENYQDIHVGDVIECFEIEEVARTL